MEIYEAQGIVQDIQSLLAKRSRKAATPEDYQRLIEWEERAEAMLQDPAVLAECRIITNEHNCNGDLEAKDGYEPSTPEELAECERWAREVLGTTGPNHLADVRHFRREPVARVEVHQSEKVVDRPGMPLQKVAIKRYAAHSAPYKSPRGTVHDTTMSGPEGYYVDGEGAVRPLGAASALLARLLEAKAAGVS